MALKRSISWMGLCQALSFLLQFAGSVVLARHLTPQEMGIYAVAVATVGLLSLAQQFGLQNFVVRQENLTPTTLRTAFTINLVINGGLALLIAALSLISGDLLGDERVRHVTLALALNPLIAIFEFLPSAQLEREGRFKALAVIGIAAGVMSAAVTVIGAIAGASYMTAAYAGWASVITGATITNIIGRRHVQFRLGLAEWRGVAHFGLQMLFTSGLHSIGSRLSDVCLGKIQGLAALGVYNRATNLNNLLWSNIHMVVGRVMFVDFAQLHRSGESLRERYIATVDVITALLWPAFAGFAVLAGPLILAVYGERWVGAAQPLAILSLASMVLVAITMTWEVFTATGNLTTQTKIEFYVAIFGTAAFIFGSVFGITAAAAARVLSAVFAVLIYWPHLNRMTGTKTADFLPVYARSAALTALAAGPAFVLMCSRGFSPRVPLGITLLSIIAGLLLWITGVVLFRHRLVIEARKVLGGRAP